MVAKRAAGAVGLLLVSAVALAIAWSATGSARGVVVWWLAVVLVGVLLPGWALVRFVRGGDASLTDLGWAGPTGVVLTLVTWLVGHLIGLSLSSLLVGPAVVGLLCAVPAARRRTLGGWSASQPWPTVAWVGTAIAVLVAVRWMWVGGLAKVAPVPTAVYQLYYPDLLYQTALTGELRRHLVPGYPMVDGEPLGYHWFFHALAAQLGGTGLNDLDVVTRLLPSTLVVLLILLAAAVGQQVTGHWTGGVGAAAVLAIGHPIAPDTWIQGALTPAPSYWQLSPTATLGWLFGLATTGCLVAVLRRSDHDSIAPRVLLPIFAIGAAGAKSAQLPVIGCGVGLAALVVLGIQWRRGGRAGGAWAASATRYAVTLGMLIVVTALAVVFLYPGSYGLRLDPAAWPTSQISLIYGERVGDGAAATAAVAVAFVRRWIPTLLPCLGLLVLVRRRPTDPTGWIGIGTVVAGAVAVLLLTHPGGSQYYFAVAAIPIGYALSGAAIGGFLWSELAPAGRRGTERRRVVQRRAALIGLVAVAGALVAVGGRRLLRTGGSRPGSLASPLEAASWGERVWTWLAPTFVVLIVMLVVATAAWLVRRREGGGATAGTWAALLAITVLAAGTTRLAPSLSLTKNPGPPRSATPSEVRGQRPGVTRALFEAGQHLRQHADPSDVIATNRVWSGLTPAGLKDNRDFSVSALSGLRSDVGGYGYAPRLLQLSQRGVPYTVMPFWDQPRLDAQLALIESPTAQTLATAYATRGVRWILADERSGPVSSDLERLADVVSREDGVWLVRLRPPPADTSPTPP